MTGLGAVKPWPVRIRWCADGPGCRICIAQTMAAMESLRQEGRIVPDVSNLGEVHARDRMAGRLA